MSGPPYTVCPSKPQQLQRHRSRRHSIGARSGTTDSLAYQNRRLDFRHDRITPRRFPSSFASVRKKTKGMVFWTNLALVVGQPTIRLTWLYVPCIQSPPEMRGNMAIRAALCDSSSRLSLAACSLSRRAIKMSTGRLEVQTFLLLVAATIALNTQELLRSSLTSVDFCPA
jgi:hypothetical protein